MKSVLVTGGDCAINQGIAERFRSLGHRVTDTCEMRDLRNRQLEVPPDIPGYIDVEMIFGGIEADNGPFDVLVVNTYPICEARYMGMAKSDFTSVAEAHISKLERIAKRAAHPMKLAQTGRIILISHRPILSYRIPPAPDQANCSVYEERFAAAHRSLVLELAPFITVNAVILDITYPSLTESTACPEVKGVAAGIPMGRVAQPGDVATAVTFFASDAAEYITGTAIRIDGGASMAG